MIETYTNPLECWKKVLELLQVNEIPNSLPEYSLANGIIMCKQMIEYINNKIKDEGIK
jgi:hypothetical protein